MEARAGDLNSDELERIVTILQNPTQFKIPTWFLNRQRDIVDGKNSQILSNAVDSKVRDDLERLKKIRAHRGLRHFWGLRVRGQHTKTTGTFHCVQVIVHTHASFQAVAARPLVCRRSVVKRFSGEGRTYMALHRHPRHYVFSYAYMYHAIIWSILLHDISGIITSTVGGDVRCTLAVRGPCEPEKSRRKTSNSLIYT